MKACKQTFGTHPVCIPQHLKSCTNVKHRTTFKNELDRWSNIHKVLIYIRALLTQELTVNIQIGLIVTCILSWKHQVAH